MNILEKLIKLMLEKVEVTPVPKQELDDFLSQNKIDICDEHYQFLLNYGNSHFLHQHYAYLVFDSFKWYYTTDNFLDDMILPKFCEYLGTDFMSEAICLDYTDKKIYSFDYGEKYEKPYYGGLKELLFFSLFQLLVEKEYFDKIETNIKIDDIKEFKLDYLNYEIKDVHIYNRYFLKDRKLIICDDNFHYYHIYYGGILNKIV